MTESDEVRWLNAVLRSEGRSFYSFPYALYLVNDALRKIELKD